MQILEPRRTRLPNPSTRCFLDPPSYVRLLLERFSVCVLTCLVPYCLGQLVHLVLCPDKCPRGPNDHWWKDDRSAQHDSQGLPSSLGNQPQCSKRLHARLLYPLLRSSAVSSRPGPKLDDTVIPCLTQLSTPTHRQNDGHPWRVPVLSSFPQKYGSLSNARLPTYNAHKAPTPDRRFGLN